VKFAGNPLFIAGTLILAVSLAACSGAQQGTNGGTAAVEEEADRLRLLYGWGDCDRPNRNWLGAPGQWRR